MDKLKKLKPLYKIGDVVLIDKRTKQGKIEFAHLYIRNYGSTDKPNYIQNWVYEMEDRKREYYEKEINCKLK